MGNWAVSWLARLCKCRIGMLLSVTLLSNLQSPLAALLGGTFPGMTLADEKQGFSKRLKEAMRRARVDAGSPTRVAREFNLRYHGDPVTTQAVRKWLAGKALPSQEKIRALALWLDVPPQWLRFGEAERKEDRTQMTAKQDAVPYKIEPGWVTRKFELLNEPHKKMVLEIVHALLRLEGKQ